MASPVLHHQLAVNLQTRVDSASHAATVTASNAIFYAGVTWVLDRCVALGVMVSINARHVVSARRALIRIITTERWAAIANA